MCVNGYSTNEWINRLIILGLVGAAWVYGGKPWRRNRPRVQGVQQEGGLINARETGRWLNYDIEDNNFRFGR